MPNHKTTTKKARNLRIDDQIVDVEGEEGVFEVTCISLEEGYSYMGVWVYSQRTEEAVDGEWSFHVDDDVTVIA